MKKILFGLLLFIGVSAFSQPPGYTYVASRYDWLAGKFRAVHVPAGTTPALATGQFTGAGALFVDSLHNRLYFYSNGVWNYSTAGSGGSTVYVDSIFSRNDSLYFIKSGTNNFIKKLQPFGSYVASTRAINTGYGLTGGGDLSADRTLVWDSSGAYVTGLRRKDSATSTYNGYVTKTWLNGVQPFTKSGNYIYQQTLTDSIGIGTNTPASVFTVKGKTTTLGNYGIMQVDASDRTTFQIDNTGRSDWFDYSGQGSVIGGYNYGTPTNNETAAHFFAGAKNDSGDPNTTGYLLNRVTNVAASTMSSQWEFAYQDAVNTSDHTYHQPNKLMTLSSAGLVLPTIPFYGSTKIGIGINPATSPLHIYGGANEIRMEDNTGGNASFINNITDFAVFAINRNPTTSVFVNTGKTAASIVLSGLSGNSAIEFQTATVNNTPPTDRWVITNSGHFIGGADNTYDIGASAATRPRTGYFGTSVVAPIFNATTGLQINGAAASRKILVADGTNFIPSTETWAVPSTSGNVLTSDGINWISAAQAGCATCVTAASALATNALVIGTAGTRASATTTTGTGVLTALGVNVGSAGAFVTFNGALGTPSSGIVTNLTGTASININGTVGATTPTTGTFTTIVNSGTITSGNDVLITHSTNGQNALQLTNANVGTAAYSTVVMTSNTAFPAYQFKLNGNYTTSGILVADRYVIDNTASSGTYIGTRAAGPVAFFTGGLADANVKLFISSAGNVGVGTISPSSLFSVGASSEFQINTSGKINNYGAVATTGWGVPAIYGTGRSTAQTAAVASVATYTVGGSDGSFIISANVLVTTSTLHNFTVTCTYTDEGNTSRTLTLQLSTIAGAFVTAITNAQGTVPYEGVPLHIRAKAGTSITIGTTGTFTTCTYNVEGNIMQIN